MMLITQVVSGKPKGYIVKTNNSVDVCYKHKQRLTTNGKQK